VTKHLPLFLAFAAILIGPIALRPRQETATRAGERTVTVITPHNEAIRYEFGRAFAAHFLAKTGQRVRVDFRTPGGTSEIARYVASEYVAAFQHHWTHALGQPWSAVIERSFSNAKINLDDIPSDDTLEQQARRAFLDSKVSCRLDLFFGGGAFDFQSQAGAGYLVDCGFVAAHPELFSDAMIPQTVGGEPFWDPKGRWIGTVLSSFGICYNTDALRRLRIPQPPRRWEDLGDPRYFHQIALANPTQSSSVNKSFEMLIQQQILELWRARENDGMVNVRSKPSVAVHESSSAPSLADVRALDAAAEHETISQGWTRAMQLLMRIGANARYFTDASTKIALDVSAGEAAAGMTIDFYGRFQSEAMRREDGSSPLQYVNAAGGTSVGVDPIGLFRGAPNEDVAREFVAFVLSPDGQKLWNWKPGTAGGPERYALRRLPILPTLYAAEFAQFRSDPEVDAYTLAKSFTYHEKWTGPLFRSIALIFRVMCVDTHEELTAAWRAIANAGFPEKAMATFSDVSAVDYAAASGRIRQVFGSDKIKEVRLAKELTEHFRDQYSRAERLARKDR